MCHAVLQDPAFFHLLTSIDQELAASSRLQGCPVCGGPLHVADYRRKPRGCPAALQEAYSRRLSFTCGRCDHRTTPPSVRFAGRRVYLAVVLMLVSPPGSASAQALCDQLHLAPSTVTRFIDTLVYRGYLERRSEGKTSRVYATTAGAELQEPIAAAWKGLHARYAEILGRAAGDDLAARIDVASEKLNQT